VTPLGIGFVLARGGPASELAETQKKAITESPREIAGA
jgi:hypothetical protein